MADGGWRTTLEPLLTEIPWMREVARSAHPTVNTRDVQNADGVQGEGEKLIALRGARLERALVRVFKLLPHCRQQASVSSRAAVRGSHRTLLGLFVAGCPF